MQIKFENVCYCYNENMPYQRQVLNAINFNITSGEFVGLVGPTGSGKTTLLQHFTGLLKPTSGKILVADRNIWNKGYPMNELRRKIGILFQFPESQLFEETVFKDVAFGPEAMGLPENEIAERVKQSLKFVGMDVEKIGERSPHHLSEGEKRRVAFAGVLAMAPDMLILDEPTAGLDYKGTQLISNILKKLSDQGITVVLISHNIDFVLGLAKRIIILNKGEVCFDGSRDELMRNQALLERSNITLPKITRLAYHLYRLDLIPSWNVYTFLDLKKQIKTSKLEG